MEFYKGMNFWNTAGEEISPPLTDLTIKNAEKALGITLPHSYIELLKEQNAGTLNYPHFFVGQDKERTTMDYMEGIDFEGVERGIGILKSAEWTRKQGLPEGLIVLWTDIHAWVVQDYRRKVENPSVVYFYEDYSSEDRQWESVEIGQDFETFLSKLFRGSTLNPKDLKTSYGRK
ncbi:SMI1/KNR4 family protein [Mesobacillus campisalis]|uniref:SMI1/KNR4 family protein n=1 Tax=Mesobacillus campisalis TaxID=1408103 RepID=UPI00069BF2B9|nr:SMI1/KNR4 family protein [Mesobacillus campisalis]